MELTDSTGTGRLLTLQAITGSPNGLRIWTEPATAHGRLRARTVVHAANQYRCARRCSTCAPPPRSSAPYLSVG